jgi:cobalamin biosynthesis Co2+ chelatase CbiK
MSSNHKNAITRKHSLILDKEETKDVTVCNIKPYPEVNILTSHMRRNIDIKIDNYRSNRA